MELIIGGAYQGKLTYAAKKYALKEEDCFDLATGLPEREYRCLYHLEALTLSAFESGIELDRFLCELIPKARDSVLISREVGCGVVPMEQSQRLWREYHGRALSRLAAEAAAVTRIFCGLPESLK